MLDSPHPHLDLSPPSESKDHPSWDLFWSLLGIFTLALLVWWLYKFQYPNAPSNPMPFGSPITLCPNGQSTTTSTDAYNACRALDPACSHIDQSSRKIEGADIFAFDDYHLNILCQLNKKAFQWEPVK